MNVMTDAMLKAGLVRAEDIERAQHQRKAEEEAERKARQLAQRYEAALIRIGGRNFEMKTWMKETGRTIPLEVLEKWASLADERDWRALDREWVKWLAAWREAQGARA